MEFDEVIRKRHATRKFKDEKIPQEKLEKILEAGRAAPTAKNLQPFKIYVVSSPEGLEKIDMASPCRYNAPTVLLICGVIEEAFQKGNHSTYEMDSVIAATHMMLEATNLGIQNIWIEMFQEEVLRKEFSLSEKLVPICLIPLGYEDENCPESPKHLIRKDLEELVEYV